MTKITVDKAVCLNENVVFPNCHVCGNETSLFCVSSEELNSMKHDTLQNLIDQQYIILNKMGIDEHVLFICTQCTKPEKVNK